MKRKDGIDPVFHPEQGVCVYGTVKDQVKTLLEEGFFDSMSTAVIAVSSESSYAIRHSGRTWEACNLAGIAHTHLAKKVLE